MLHINEIFIDKDDEWSKIFNSCSLYWKKSQDNLLSEIERKEAFDLWSAQRQCLELGIG